MRLLDLSILFLYEIIGLWPGTKIKQDFSKNCFDGLVRGMSLRDTLLKPRIHMLLTCFFTYCAERQCRIALNTIISTYNGLHFPDNTYHTMPYCPHIKIKGGRAPLLHNTDNPLQL